MVDDRRAELLLGLGNRRRIVPRTRADDDRVRVQQH
jgi:hypothetical protein